MKENIKLKQWQQAHQSVRDLNDPKLSHAGWKPGSASTKNMKTESNIPTSRNTPYWLQRLVRLLVKCLPLTPLRKSKLLFKARIVFFQCRNHLLRLRICNLRICIFIGGICHQCRMAFLKLIIFFLELEQGVLVIIHNLILYYSTPHDKRPNDAFDFLKKMFGGK